MTLSLPSVLVAATMAGSVAPPRPIPPPAAAVATTSEPTPPAKLTTVRVEVDHTPLLESWAESAEAWGQWVGEDVTASLTDDHGLTVAPGADVPAVQVRLSWVDSVRMVYQIELSTQRPGEQPVVVASFEAECPTTKCLTTAVVERVPDAVKQLREQLAAEAVANDTPPNDADPPHDPEGNGQPAEPGNGGSDDPKPDPGPRLTGLGYGGIVLAGLGVGAAVAGGVLIGRHDVSADVDLRGYNTYNSRPAGIGLVASGAASIAIGIVMLAVDRSRLRRRGKTRAALHVDPRFSSASLSLRF